MDRSNIIDIFKIKGIIGPSGKRKFCWKDYWDEESDIIFTEYSNNYRTEEEAWFCLIHDIKPHKCEICGNLAVFNGRLKSKYPGYNTVCENCSANQVLEKRNKFQKTIKNKTKQDWKIREDKRRKTMEEKYGDPILNLFGTESHKQRMLDIYGDVNYNNREKYKKTMNEKYGVDHNFQLHGHVKKSIDTKIKKYGNASNYEKTKQTNKLKYGKEHVSQVKSFQIKSSIKKVQNILKLEKEHNCIQDKKLRKKYGVGWKSLDLEKIKIGHYVFISNDDIPLIESYKKEKRSHLTSIKEKELLTYIKSIYSGRILENDINTIKSANNRFYELDIYLPELKLAFDFNGMYWHSDKYKDKYYHQRKLLKCYEAGIQLIHIYENDWDKGEDIKMKIKETIYNVNNGIKYGWIPVNYINEYEISEPMLINHPQFNVYNEGQFKLKNII